MKVTTESARIFFSKISACKVECEVTKGVGIHLVGMVDRNVKETLLRVMTSLQACGYRIPGKKIIINVISGGGSIHVDTEQLDLAIAISLLAASGQISEKAANGLEKFYIIGELGLDGKVRMCRDGAILASLLLEKGSDRAIILPAGSAMEAWNQFGRKIYAVENLYEAIEVAEKLSPKYLLWNSKRFVDALDEVLKMRDESKTPQLTSSEE